ncbi:hypothetical protein BX616_009043, partial [Lobosporangium transversale]
LCAQSLYLSVHQSVPQFDLTVESAKYLNPSQARAFSDLQLKMRAILDAFVLPSSPHELNLSDATRCSLLRAVAEGIAAKRASSASSARSQSDSEKPSHDHDNPSWRHKAKHSFKLVSKMLKRSP